MWILIATFQVLKKHTFVIPILLATLEEVMLAWLKLEDNDSVDFTIMVLRWESISCATIAATF